jgi:hypothetical protein
VNVAPLSGLMAGHGRRSMIVQPIEMQLDVADERVGVPFGTENGNISVGLLAA